MFQGIPLIILLARLRCDKGVGEFVSLSAKDLTRVSAVVLLW